MKRRLFEFTCPFCSKSYFLARDTYLIRDANSLEYERLKDGSYFRHQCQTCKNVFDLEYPLIYRDPRQNLSIIRTQGEVNGLSGKAVLTRNTRQFLEAFSILDLQLDLKEVLKIKRAYEKESGKSTRVVDYDAKKGILWLDQSGSLIGVGYPKSES